MSDEVVSEIDTVRLLVDERNKRLAEIAALDMKIHQILVPEPAQVAADETQESSPGQAQ